MKKLLYIVSFIFFIFLLIFFYLQKKYITESANNYTSTIQKEIEILIDTKKINTLEIAKNLSIDKRLIKIIKQKKYKMLYKNHFFSIADDYKTFQHIGIHIVDKQGFQRYISWSKKSLGKNVLSVRPDLAKVLQKPKITSSISSGLFDLTFKAIVPIFDKQHHLLALLEVITHFNSIAKELEKQKIYSAIILNKKESKNIKYHLFGSFIDGYFISTKITPKIREILKNCKLSTFINIPYNSYKYIPSQNDLDGYFVVNVPIKSNDNKTLAHYIAFIYDTNHLKEKEITSYIIMLIITILFVVTLFIAYKQLQENENLINSLNEEIEKQIDEKLEMIYTDQLTKAYKKTKFDVDKMEEKNKDVVMLNIKNFSKINELYGFRVGDEVLKITTHRIEKILDRKIYRINADEFVFFSNHIKEDISRIKELFIVSPITLDKENIKIRLSFSFSVTENEGDEILRKLSIALKEAKTKPFKKYILYKEKPVKNDFIKFNSILYDAIFIHKKAEIVPFFQGIKNNKTGKINKYESLARLKSDKIYSPFFFIEIAKNSGFLFEITKIMIDKTLFYISKQKNDLEVSINITEDDLLTSQLKDFLIIKTTQYNVNPNRVTLEILEGITSNGAKDNITQLKELKELGFKLAIDDFGVEYSNFERINELDIDFIKIDAKYIKHIHQNEKSYKIAKAITDFAHSLNIEVVAEYVENEDIQKVIEELGIEFSQGYYFSIPQEKIEN